MQFPRAFASLNIPGYRWLFASNLAFFFVVQGQFVTRMFLTWDLTGQETALATLSIASALPMLLGSMIGGAIADRVNRKRLVLLGQAVLVGTEAAILVLIVLGKLEFWHLLVGSTINGFAYPFILATRMTIVFDVVGSSYFSNAVALSNSVVNLTRIGGPAILGILLDIGGAESAYILAVLLHLVAWICVAGLKYEVDPVPSTKPLFADTVAGFRYVIHSKPIRVLIAFGFIGMLLLIPVQNLFVVFTDEVWLIGERGLGLLMGATGVGGLAGTLWVAGRSHKTNQIALMIVSTLAFCLFLLGFSLSPSFWLAAVLLMLGSMFFNISQTLNNALTLTLSDESMRGRVSGIMGMSFGVTPLAVIPVAFAAEQFGVQSAVATTCVLCLLLTLLAYFGNQTLQTMNARAKQKLIEEKQSNIDNLL